MAFSFTYHHQSTMPLRDVCWSDFLLFLILYALLNLHWFRGYVYISTCMVTRHKLSVSKYPGSWSIVDRKNRGETQFA